MSDSTDDRIEFAKEFATLIADVRHMREKLDKFLDEYTRLEARVRALEEFRWKLVGAGLASGAMGAGLVEALKGMVGN